jgi:enediyne biosynthesis protein E4
MLKPIHKLTISLISIICLCLFQCKKGDKLFEKVNSSHSNIHFNNSITTNDSLNILRFENIYNGAGLATADFNNDGKLDVFFAGSQVSSKLYLNKGDLTFEDVTEKAHLTTNRWCTGVAAVDINSDGRMDIHVSTIHPKINQSAENYFFINQGNDANGTPIFEEKAKEMGLNDKSYSIQAAFLDYDLDGDLDMYLLTNSMESYNRNIIVPQVPNPNAKSLDLFYENKGADNQGLPHFENVSQQVGFLQVGWGLGVVVNDFNNDGYPDVYASNDFISNDHLYINQKNKTFKDEIGLYMQHNARNSMGVDMADINNDGLNDLVAVDMLPDDNLRKKTMFPDVDFEKYDNSLAKGYMPQFVRNVLQLNNGNGTFSEIAYMAGIAATDWSWTPLIADFDMDGNRDILISNGYKLDITDLDFVTYRDENDIFGASMNERLNKMQEAFNGLKGVKKHNFFFKNEGDLKFSDKTIDVGLDQPSYSNGTAYADFDNDGDLDLVMNNIDDEAFLYENLSRKEKEGNNSIQFKFENNNKAFEPYGAKIEVFYQGNKQYAEYQTIKGYKSTLDPRLFFGLGLASKVDSVVVYWSKDKKSIFYNLAANKIHILNPKILKNIEPTSPKTTDFMMLDDNFGIDFIDKQAEFNDFAIQQTKFINHSEQGPSVAVADVNGDKLDDVYIGGAAHESGILYIQNTNSRFTKMVFPAKDQEEVSCIFIDVDGDKDQDLYCVAGSTEFGQNYLNLQDLLYLNDGKGRFTKSQLPDLHASGSVAMAVDVENDGDMDIFRAATLIPNQYPVSPESYVLINDGKGKFTIGNKEKTALGNITGATFADLNKDNYQDLIVLGEFMPLTIYKNQKGKLDFTNPIIVPNTEGIWQSILADDVDNDGDIDFIGGNIGLNLPYKATDNEPFKVYAKDFDVNGNFDAIFGYYLNGKEYPVHPRGTMIAQLISTRRRYATYADYGKATMDDFLPKDERKGILELSAKTFEHLLFKNEGDFKFSTKPLPNICQISTINSITVEQQKGGKRYIYAGNNFGFEVLSGKLDASLGGVFSISPNQKIQVKNNTGLNLSGYTKRVGKVNLANRKTLYLATVCNRKPHFFQPVE